MQIVCTTAAPSECDIQRNGREFVLKLFMHLITGFHFNTNAHNNNKSSVFFKYIKYAIFLGWRTDYTSI